MSCNFWRDIVNCSTECAVPEIPVYIAYFMGGQTVNTIDGLSFLDDSLSNKSAVLSQARYNSAGVNSLDKGYCAGGIYVSELSIIDGLVFDSETAFLSSATLAVSRSRLTGVNSSDRGYFAGGRRSTTAYDYESVIDGIQFNTDSAISSIATLVETRQHLFSCTSDTKGYFAGGNAPISSNIHGLRYDTETVIDPIATLVEARYAAAGVNSTTKGYFGGGNYISNKTQIDGIIFDTDTGINPSASLSVAIRELAGANSDIKGYFAGGTNPTTNRIEDFVFDTESISTITATLSSARSALIGVQSGGYL